MARIRAQPPVLPLAGDSGRVVKDVGPGASTGTSAAPSGKDGSRASRSASPSSAHTITTGRPPLLPEAGGEVGPVDRRQSGHRHRGLSAVQRCQQLLKFRQLSQNRAEYLHQISLLVPIYPMIWKSKAPMPLSRGIGVGAGWIVSQFTRFSPPRQGRSPSSLRRNISPVPENLKVM